MASPKYTAAIGFGCQCLADQQAYHLSTCSSSRTAGCRPRQPQHCSWRPCQECRPQVPAGRGRQMHGVVTAPASTQVWKSSPRAAASPNHAWQPVSWRSRCPAIAYTLRASTLQASEGAARGGGCCSLATPSMLRCAQLCTGRQRLLAFTLARSGSRVSRCTRLGTGCQLQGWCCSWSHDVGELKQHHPMQLPAPALFGKRTAQLDPGSATATCMPQLGG